MVFGAFDYYACHADTVRDIHGEVEVFMIRYNCFVVFARECGLITATCPMRTLDLIWTAVNTKPSQRASADLALQQAPQTEMERRKSTLKTNDKFNHRRRVPLCDSRTHPVHDPVTDSQHPPSTHRVSLTHHAAHASLCVMRARARVCVQFSLATSGYRPSFASPLHTSSRPRRRSTWAMLSHGCASSCDAGCHRRHCTTQIGSVNCAATSNSMRC